MDRVIWSLAVLLLLGGCAAFLADDPMPLGDQLWRDAKGIRH